MDKFDFYFNLFFVSHNKVKIVHLLKIFDKLKIPLKIYRSKIREYDEEPSESIEKAMFLSVESVKKKLRHLGMFFIEDSTFTIDAFSTDGKDIPGLATKAFFKKYTHADINKFITQKGKHNRKAVMSSRLTLNIPGSNTPEIFSSHVKGIISEKDNDMAKSNAPIWIKDAPFASFSSPMEKVNR